jgi:predicted AlkP superfamily phosphohydrolase/phosphomutase
MGFRELELFNVAMMDKHGWRLITNPNSLCSRVLKARYYPDCGFLQATVPKRSYATWRAVVVGREALEQGLISRIGDVSHTSV